MKYIDESKATVDPQWLSLYYGDKVITFQATKASIDSGNIFHSELSILASNRTFGPCHRHGLPCIFAMLR